MTHFATADDDPAFAREQLARFLPWARRAARARHGDLLLHAANSAATLGDPGVAPRTSCAAGSPSTAWTRSATIPAPHGLEPALELRSYVAEVKRDRAGGERGLRAPLRRAARRPGSARCRSATPTACAARSTNDGDVLVGGRRVPLVGTVSMDNVTVDLGPASRRRAARRSC